MDRVTREPSTPLPESQTPRSCRQTTMDSPENPDPTFSAGSFWISMGKNSQDSEMLTKNLSKLTLNPSATKTSPAQEEPPQQSDRVVKMVIQKRQRRGVRTMLSERRERLAKLKFLLTYQYSQVKQRRGDDLNEVKGESRSELFRCCCSYCLAHGWDPSENARIGMDYDSQFKHNLCFTALASNFIQ